MRGDTTGEKVRAFMEALGRASSSPGRVYLTGGSSAVLIGWRLSTVDIDLRLDPEPAGAFEALRRLKDELQINVELASPQDFIPPVPGWERASVFIARHGDVSFYHYDFRGQALAKLERGHGRDLLDVSAMLERGLVTADAIRESFAAIRAEIVRYPSVDADGFERRVAAFLAGLS